MSVPSRELQIEMLRKMILIRAFEEKMKLLFTHGFMAGFSHLYDGQEAVAVGVCSASLKTISPAPTGATGTA